MTEQPHLQLELFSQPRYLAATRSLIAAVAQRMGFAECTCGQIALALDEALCNVINHGYQRAEDGRIWISVWPLGNPPTGIRILIEDRGCQVEPETIRSRDLDEIRPGGLGVYIISRIMDRAEFSKREGGGMALLLEKDLDVEGEMCCPQNSAPPTEASKDT